MVERIRVVRLPDGEILSVADLPDPGVVRWTVVRKQNVVRAVVHGLISQQEAIEKYELSEDEFLNWLQRYREFGTDGLKSTKMQAYRQPRR